MKKRGLLFAAVLVLGLSGCQEKEPQEKETQEEILPLPEEEESEEEIKEYPTELSGHLYDFQFAVNGNTKTLPSKMEEWLGKGWEFHPESQETKLETESYIEGETLEGDQGSLLVDVVNLEGEQKSLKDCYIGGAVLEYSREGYVYQLPGGITLGKSVLNEVTEAYGTPTDEYSEKDDIYITYEFGTYKKAEFVFDIEDEVLFRAVLKNYREPADEEEEISQEEPEAVAAYREPQDFTQNPADYIVSYDGNLYEIPAPVSQFTRRGWSIQEEGSDTYVKAGRHGYVTLEKDGAVLYAVVKNYGDQTVPVANTFVTNVSGDFDVVKVPIAIGKGITLGMSEENMKIQLGGSTYEAVQEGQGTSYYLYSDDTGKNFIRIFVDKDLRLIREIEVSNSPETLTGSYREEEDSPDSSVPLGEGL